MVCAYNGRRVLVPIFFFIGIEMTPKYILNSLIYPDELQLGSARVRK